MMPHFVIILAVRHISCQLNSEAFNYLTVTKTRLSKSFIIV